MAVSDGVRYGWSLESVRMSWCASLPGLPKSSITKGRTLWVGYLCLLRRAVWCAACPSLRARWYSVLGSVEYGDVMATSMLIADPSRSRMRSILSSS